MSFRAIRVTKDEQGHRADTVTLEEHDLHEGDVTVAVDYSTVNYKDGLALAHGKGIVRTYPLVPGIDFAGTVESSTHASFAPGDKVVLNGYGVGEGHDGGFAQKARVSGDWLVPLPRSPRGRPQRSAPPGTRPCSACSPWRTRASPPTVATCSSPGPRAVSARSP